MSGAIPRPARKHVIPSSRGKKSIKSSNVSPKNFNLAISSPDQNVYSSPISSLTKADRDGNSQGGVRSLNDAHLIGKLMIYY